MSPLPAIINAAAEWIDGTVPFRHQELVRGVKQEDPSRVGVESDQFEWAC